MNQKMKAVLICIMVLTLAVMIPSCANLSKMLDQMNVKEPAASVEDARITGLDFEKIDLMFGIDIKNPNSVGIAMDGFDYDLLLNENSFISGNKNEKLNIEAQGTSRVDFPVSLKFVDIYNMFNSLKSADSTKYQVKLGLIFNLPVLGATRIPISHTGHLPIPKLPSISVKDLKMNSFGFTGANLDLKIGIANPNAFSMIFDKLNYNFQINGLDWASGQNTRPMQVNEKGEGIVTIPVKLDFLQMGQSVYQLINGTSNLNYKLSGKVDMSSNISILGKHSLPFDQSGNINLKR
jgi:LEA14-like dessication related protein